MTPDTGLTDPRRLLGEKISTPRVYVVKAGDSLSKIAGELLGDADRWKEIFEANKAQIKDPNVLNVGQELTIPDK